jgi:hypothetical protein
MGLPRESGEERSRQLTWRRRMGSVKSINKIITVGKMSDGFPTVVTIVIAFPLDQILMLIAEVAAVKNIFDFILKFLINLNMCRRGWSLTIDFIFMPGGKSINMEDGVLVHIWRETELICKVTSALKNFIWSKLARP